MKTSIQHIVARKMFRLGILIITLFSLALLVPSSALADPYPPQPTSGLHYPAIAWPDAPANPTNCGFACGDWIPYTRYATGINDPRVQDPSNGGTSPQNYVNIASSCIDRNLPSIYYYIDPASQTLMFRWRVEQIANTYATGPSAGAYGGTDPWKSGLWTVFFDLNGDGYRDLASHLNGSSGEPATPVDMLVGVWGNIPNNNSLDYTSGDPNIVMLGHNPTALVDPGNNRILNFHSSLAPNTSWPNGSAETVWDYGTTRSVRVIGQNCEEYFVDYQIPLQMLDATSRGGPAITMNTPFSMLFCTANSLNDPLQKDCTYPAGYTSTTTGPAPFGDILVPNMGILQQPTITTLSASGCGPVSLKATVMDTIDIINNVATSSVSSVSFYYYADLNSNGQADDSGVWTEIPTPAVPVDINDWALNWNTSSLLRGAYLIGVRATDKSNPANVSFSFLTQQQVNDLVAGDQPTWFTNPSASGLLLKPLNNTCGAPPPFVTKSASASTLPAGSTVDFTITVHNPLATPLIVNSLADDLPAGFTYHSTLGGTLGAAAYANGVWNFSPAATVTAGGTGTLIFRATAPATIGSFANTASASTSYGSLRSSPVTITVGAPKLTVSKTANISSVNPGGSVVYTISYANDSPINVTNVVIQDILPAELTFVSATEGGTYTSGTRTINWNVGNLAAGSGPFSVSFTATVQNPFPAASNVRLPNTVTIDAAETDPSSSTATVYVNAPRPRLVIQKDANVTQVAVGGTVQFTLRYENTGNATATSVIVQDVLPVGFTPTPNPPPGATYDSGTRTITWALASPVNAGASGTLTFNATVASGAVNPSTNTATIASAETNPVSDSFNVGITQSACNTTTYYFHQSNIANLTAPVAGDPTQIDTFLAVGDVTPVVIGTFYQTPAQSGSSMAINGAYTVSFYASKDGAPAANFTVTLYDYNPSTGTSTQIGTGTQRVTGNTKIPQLITVTTSNVVYVLAPDHQLRWVFTVISANNTNNIDFAYNSTTYPAQSAHCSTQFQLDLNKQVNNLSITPGGTLQYSIKFANPGLVSVTNAQIVEALPAGVTYVTGSAQLNGATTVPTSTSPLTFRVNTSGAAAGTLAAGGSGTLTFNVTVNQPLPTNITELLNQATLTTNQTAALNDTALTIVKRPVLSITKSVSPTRIGPGGTATYTLQVRNTGDATATNVTLSDSIPANAYYTYVSGSTTVNGASVPNPAFTGNTFTLNIGSLNAGATATVTFQMCVTGTAPVGTTLLDNTASVNSTQTPSVSSNIATVSITTDPRLVLSKSMQPGSGLAAGSLVTYTLTLANTGTGAAVNVLVTDPIPASMSYVPGSLRVDGAAQTDAADLADNSEYDVANNQVVFRFDPLNVGATRTLRFQARLASPLPLSINVTNTATAVASNAAPRQASVSATVTSAPVLDLDKTGPTSLAYPAAQIVDASGFVTVTLSDITQLAPGQYIRVGSETRQIQAVVAPGQVIINTPLSAAANTPVYASLTYFLAYQNTSAGTATASNVTLVDTLPAGSTFITATTGYVGDPTSTGIVQWDLGSLEPGQSGVKWVTIFPPSGVSSITNNAVLNSAETAPVTASLVTAIGGLRVYKEAVTPTFNQTAITTDDDTVTYLIRIVNTSASPASSVSVNDHLSAGFMYVDTTAYTGNSTPDPSFSAPSAGTSNPVWGTWTIPGNGELAITYRARVSEVVGPDVYENAVRVSASGVGVTQFDELNNTSDNVRVNVAYIYGRAYHDLNGNGVYDLGEPLLGGVTINLRDWGLDGIPDNGDDVVYTDTTQLDGSYLFDALDPARIYTVSEKDPAGYGPGTANSVENITLTPGEHRRIDFGDEQGGLTGRVYFDADGDGQQDVGEPGLANVQVTLSNGSSAITGADGRYMFGLLPPGNYTISVTSNTVPAGLTVTQVPATPIRVTAGVMTTGVDFGYTNGNPNTVIIGDTVWSDANHNGVQDPGEPGLGGVQMAARSAGVDGLYGTPDDFEFTVSTSPAGTFLFTNLPPGEYRVSVTGGIPAGYTPTSPAFIYVNPLPGQADLNADFGYHNPSLSSITDRVWLDSNRNGIYDIGELGIPGVPVMLATAGVDNILGTADDITLATTFTAPDGSISFAGIPSGSYRIKLLDTAGILNGLLGVTPTAQNGFLNVASGSSASSFPFYMPGLIGDTVYYDANNNGIQDPGEPGLGGQIVTLRSAGPNRVWDAVNDVWNLVDDWFITTTTRPDGSYQFAGLDYGLYEVRINSSQLILFTLDKTNTSNLNADFGLYTAALPGISGSVWKDLDADALDDGDSEPPLAGITLVLFNSAGQPVATTVTQNDGSYSFSGLTDGSYSVMVSDPSGQLNGYYLTSGVDRYPVSLHGASVTGIDFGYVQRPATASIGDRVWIDANHNGIQDVTDGGLGGVTLELYRDDGDGIRNAGDTFAGTTTSDFTGAYQFTNLPSGSYFVDIASAPAGLSLVPGSTDPSPIIHLSAGEAYLQADFGYVSSSGVSLGDRVWYDANRNGAQDLGEPGMGGITVTVQQGGNTYTVTTNPDGSWLVNGLNAGSCTVTVSAPAYHAVTNGNSSRTYTLLADRDFFYADFGLVHNTVTYRNIGDQVYLDANRNGTQDAGEPGLAGVTLELRNAADQVIATTTTTSDGSYRFSGLADGSYQVRVTDYDQVLNGYGSTGSIISPASVTLAGSDNLNVDFGYAPVYGMIGDRVWRDLNRNGIYDAGEPGILGVSLRLWMDVDGDGQIDPSGDNLVRATVTNEYGLYDFRSLPAGPYLVEVTDVNRALTGLTRSNGTGALQPLVLSTGGINLNADFGYRASTTEPLTITGVVFNDTNDPIGTYNQGEPLIFNVQMLLYQDLDGDGRIDANDPRVALTRTNGQGAYTFADVPPGNYLVVAQTQDSYLNGFFQTTQQSAVQAGVQAVSITTASSTGNNFGFYAPGGSGTTPVTLSFFQATQQGEGVHFEWSTATETANLGFYLYAEDDQGVVQPLTPELIPSLVIDSIEPQDYSLDITPLSAQTFYIEDVDVFGEARRHGPFTLGEAFGSRFSGDRIDWESIHAEDEVLEAQYQAEAQPAVQAEADQAAQAPDPGFAIYLPAIVAPEDTHREDTLASVKPSPVPRTPTLMHFKVEQTGLYRITYEMLRTAGLDLKGVPVTSIALTNRGQPIQVKVSQNGRFGPGGYLEFYGEALDTLYTRTNVYTLYLDSRLARRPKVSPALPMRGVAAVPYYMETYTGEREAGYSPAAPNGDPWFYGSLYVTRTSQSWTLPVPIEDYAPNAAPATLFVDVWGYNDLPQNPDHHLVLHFNDQMVADRTFNGVVDVPITVTLPAEITLLPANSLKFTLPADMGGVNDLINLDRFSLSYPRRFVARGGQLTFRAAGQVFQVENLTTDAVSVYRLDPNGLTQLSRVEVTQNGNTYTARFAGKAEAATYLVYSDNALLKPETILAQLNVEITSGPAQYLIISHPNFISGLAPLVAARQAQGFSVKVVNVNDVYAQFGYHIFDPQPIRDYIRYAAQKMGTQYVLLVGGDTYDYLNYTKQGSISFIPSIYAPLDPQVLFAPADPLYADVDSNGVPDLAIGRFPVRTQAELALMVSKTLSYANKNYSGTAVFTADQVDRQLSFTVDSESFIAKLPQGWNVQRVYLDQLSLATARQRLLQSLNSGVALTSYVGHSANDRWTFKGLFNTNDAAALTNIDRPTVVMQWGCWTSYYVSPVYNTLAHKFLLSGRQGAAAVMGATTLTEASSERLLAERLTPYLTTPGVTLGEAMLRAKQNLSQTHSGLDDVILGWTLLGDPALMIQP